MDATLFLIPVTLGDAPIGRSLPPYNKEIIVSLRHFIVENVRSARRFLKQVEPEIDIDRLIFYELNEHTAREALPEMLCAMEGGESMGLLSEAGCPAVADPGAEVVAMVQERGWVVKPLVGPSSIMLALMASGLNGQRFAFHGYLPIDSALRVKALRQLEQRALSVGESQWFIETPYRNQRMMEDILAACRGNTRVCVAMDLTLSTEEIRTRRVAEWRGEKAVLGKRLCVFGVGG